MSAVFSMPSAEYHMILSTKSQQTTASQIPTLHPKAQEFCPASLLNQLSVLNQYRMSNLYHLLSVLFGELLARVQMPNFSYTLLRSKFGLLSRMTRELSNSFILRILYCLAEQVLARGSLLHFSFLSYLGLILCEVQRMRLKSSALFMISRSPRLLPGSVYILSDMNSTKKRHHNRIIRGRKNLTSRDNARRK